MTSRKQKPKPPHGLFNIYGRIIFKQKKGCSYFYTLITYCQANYDCLTITKHCLERKLLESDKDVMFDNSLHDMTITKLTQLRDFNFLKEFGILLFWNNFC